MKVFPTIMTDIPSELSDMLDKSEGAIDIVQIDIVDGVFVDNKTIDPADVDTLTYSLSYDFHLMVQEPIKWIEKCFQAGGDRIIGHIELMGDQIAFVDKVKSLEVKAGLAVDFDTGLDELEPDVLSDLDVILLMDYPAGFAGQEFREETLDKIRKVDGLRRQRDYKYKICVDGGVMKENIARIAKAGADEAVVGRRIFDGDVSQNIQSYKDAAER